MPWQNDVDDALSEIIFEEANCLCVGCPDAHHEEAGESGPEEWWCSKEGVFPGGERCLERNRIEEAIGHVAKAAEVLCEERRKEDYFDD